MRKTLITFVLAASVLPAQVKLPGKIAEGVSGKQAAAPAAASGPGAITGKVGAQTVELTLTEAATRNGNDVIASKPTKVFAYRGSNPNVAGVLRFTPALQGAASVKVTILKNGSIEDDRDVTYQTGGRTGAFTFTLTPGKYDVVVSDKFDTAKIYLRDQLTVSADAVGERAVGNVKAASGTMQACKDVVDAKCVGESATQKAGGQFYLMVSMTAAMGTGSQMNTAWVIYKQKPDGTDGSFVDSVIQTIEDKYKKWWTADISFAPGTYTVYSVHNQQNQSSEKSGNLTNYFAKMTLTVK